MNKRKFISKKDSRMLWNYLFYTFDIAWGTEFILIILFRFNLLNENATLFLYFTVIGFGAGMAPAYAAFPWYLFILFMPMMIWGGDLEEI